MKKLTAAVLLFAALHARADMVITQRMEMQGQSQQLIMKIKGDKCRADVGEVMSNLLDLKTGDLVMLFHQEKKFLKLSAVLQKAEMTKLARGKKGKPEEQPKLVDTGTKEKVGDWTAEVYTASGPGAKYTFWISTDLPNWEAVRAELKKMDDVRDKQGEKVGPDTSKIPGLMVKSREEHTDDQDIPVIIMTLISAKEEAVSDAELVIPKGYTAAPEPGAMQPDGAMPVTVPGNQPAQDEGIHVVVPPGK